MNLSDIFRSFLGLNRNPSGADSFHNDFRNPIWNVDDDDDTDDELYHHYGGNGTGNFQGGFQVFSNPLEMQRYFEQQMGEILKSFGGMMGTFGNELSPPSTNELPHFGLPSIREKRERSIRDEYLKPGYRSPDLSQRQNRTDSDLDGKMTSDDLDSLFDKKLEGSSQFDLTEEGTSKLEKYTPRSPLPSQPKQHSMFYGQTFMRKSVLLPDGSIETTETRKSSDGQEETTVTISPGRGAGGGSPGALTEPFDNMWTNFFGR